jgi:DNA repair exonuclease SbcCD nuclease subunit
MDYFNIGMLHTAVDGRRGHDLYAPCNLSRLQAKGYDYWALGHVHQREVLCEDPWILFPGNLQGRHAREIGSKGVSLVSVKDGVVVTVEHRSLDVVRWTQCWVDCTEAMSGLDLVDLAREAVISEAETAEGRLLAIRLHMVGTSQAHRELAGDPERWTSEIRATIADLGAEVWMEKIQLRTRATLDLDVLLEHDDPVAGLLLSLRELRTDESELNTLLRVFDDLKSKLPVEYRQWEEALNLDDPATLKTLLEDVEQILISRLLEASKVVS